MSMLSGPPSALRRSFSGSSNKPLLEKTLGSNKFLKSTIFEFIGCLCSDQILAPEDPLWQQLGQYSLPSVLNVQDSFELEFAIHQTVPSLLRQDTRNLNTLILFFLSGLKRTRNRGYHGEWSQLQYNLLFCVYVIVKYILEQDPLLELYRLLDSDQTDQEQEIGSPLSVGSRRSSLGLPLTIDAQIQHDKRPRSLVLMEELLQAIIYADTLKPVNFQFYIYSLRLVIVMFSTQLLRKTHDHLDWFAHLFHKMSHFSKGLVHRLLRNIVQMQPSPSNNSLFFSFIFTDTQSHLSDTSLYLFLLLSQQQDHFTDAIGALEDKAHATPQVSEFSLVDFRELFGHLIKNMQQDKYLVLFYLLFQNQRFRRFCLSRLDPETLLLELIKKLYSVLQIGSFPFLYILCLVFCDLSQDELYLESIHKTTIQKPQWFQERGYATLSLGDLFLASILRLSQTNFKSKDLFVHSSVCMILYHLGKRIIHMNAVLSQKVMSLFGQHLKRLQHPGHEDLCAAFLELMHGAIQRSALNPNFIYSLLQEEDLLRSIDNPRLQPMASSLCMCLDTIKQKLSDLESLGHVLQIIQSTPLVLEKQSELEFRRSIPTNMFLRLVWSMIYTDAGIYFDATLCSLLDDLEL